MLCWVGPRPCTGQHVSDQSLYRVTHVTGAWAASAGAVESGRDVQRLPPTCAPIRLLDARPRARAGLSLAWSSRL